MSHTYKDNKSKNNMTKKKTDNHSVDNKQSIDNKDFENSCDCEATNCEDDNLTDQQPEVCDNTSENSEDWKNKYLRLSAEFDNYRKRTLKERIELIGSAGEEMIKSILPVVDDFDRACVAMENVTDVSVVKEGTALIAKKLFDILGGRGVVEIEALGLELDTDLHEAIARFPVEDQSQKGLIIDVVQKGYKLKDKVIRHSKVVVGE